MRYRAAATKFFFRDVRQSVSKTFEKVRKELRVSLLAGKEARAKELPLQSYLLLFTNFFKVFKLC